MKAPEGKALFGQLMSSMMQATGGKAMGFDITEGMMQMMGGFTIVRLTSLLGAADMKISKEQLLGLNAMLNKIKKVD